MPRPKHSVPRVPICVRLPLPLVERLRTDASDPIFHTTRQGGISDAVIRALTEYYRAQDERANQEPRS